MQYNIEKKLTIEFYPREKIIYEKERKKILYRLSVESQQQTKCN